MTATWETGDGRQVPISQMEDSHLASVLRMLRRRAVKLWRDGGRSQETWESLTPRIWDDLVAEAERRSLHWGEMDPDERSKLERGIVGALRDCIHAHGPITRESAPSAAKRVIGVIKSHSREIRDADQASESGV